MDTWNDLSVWTSKTTVISGFRIWWVLRMSPFENVKHSEGIFFLLVKNENTHMDYLCVFLKFEFNCHRNKRHNLELNQVEVSNFKVQDVLPIYTFKTGKSPFYVDSVVTVISSLLRTHCYLSQTLLFCHFYCCKMSFIE